MAGVLTLSTWLALPSPLAQADDASSSSWGSPTLSATLPGLAPTFGYATALSSDGTTALVGAPAGRSYNGAAFVYSLTSTGWQRTATLNPDGVDAHSDTGYSVAISGDGATAVVGSPFDSNSSGVTVFADIGGRWVEQAQFHSPTGELGDPFGSEVAISRDGSTIVVGDDSAKRYRGLAATFVRGADGQWQAGPVLTARNGSKLDQFGASVAVSADGATIAVGADRWRRERGNVVLFAAQPSGGWAQVQRVIAPRSHRGDEFGRAVSLSDDGGTLAVGAPYRGSGQGFVFDRGADGTYGYTATLDPTYVAVFPSDAISLDVSADGDTVLMGLPARNILLGAAQVFTSDAGTWSVAATLVPSETQGITGGAGTSVSLSGDGDTAMLGAPDGTSSFHHGSVFVYHS